MTESPMTRYHERRYDWFHIRRLGQELLGMPGFSGVDGMVFVNTNVGQTLSSKRWIGVDLLHTQLPHDFLLADIHYQIYRYGIDNAVPFAVRASYDRSGKTASINQFKNISFVHANSKKFFDSESLADYYQSLYPLPLHILKPQALKYWKFHW